jgi:hypothetical protein
VLNKVELNDLFLKVNNEYLSAVSRPISEYIDNPKFKRIREELRLITNELRRRRGAT